jgi:hypothetical protein
MKHSRLSELRSKVGPAWTRLDRGADTAIRYANCLGAVRGLALYALTSVRQPSRGRVVEATVVGTGVKLLVRLGTSDVSVYNRIFCWREYEWHFEKSPKVIVDASAYTGLSSAYFAMRYPEDRIIAIEPGRSNYNLLVRNTGSFGNVHPVHAALWTSQKPVTLIDPGYGAWGLQVREGSMGDDTQDKAGCSRSFFNAVKDFPIGLWHGENVFVARPGSSLVSRDVQHVVQA